MLSQLKRRSPPTLTGRPVFVPGILLALPEPTTADGEFENPRWVQIAREGTFKGHPNHTEGFELTKALFEVTVANFRKSPAYRPGADGVGTEYVIPYDYEHASEKDPTQGSIPQQGAGAPAWAMDLAVRDGESGAELWAWTWFGDKAVEQVRAKEYRWTSMALWKNAIDPESGERIGPYLSSVALTNHPFISGMAPIAARAYVSRAETAEEALVGLRDIFGLPADATPEFVAGEVAAFQRMLASGTVPATVEPTWLLDAVRSLLAMRVLASQDEIISAAIALLAGLTANQQPAAQPPPAAPPVQEIPMSQNPETAHLSLKLAQLYKVRDKDDAILAAAAEGQEALDAIDKLKKLFEAPDIAKTIESAVNLVAKVSENAGLLESIAALKAALAGKDEALKSYEEAEAAVETEAVVASRVAGISDVKARKDATDALRPYVLAARKACIGDKVKLEQFRKDNPLPEKERLTLTQRIFAGPNGEQYGSPAATGAPKTAPLPPEPRGEPGAPTGKAALLRNQPGGNNVQKAIAYLATKEPGFGKLDSYEQVRRAGAWLENPEPAAQ